MAKSGIKHIDVGAELTKTEWESEDSHEILHGNSFPGSPVERQLFYRDDEHKWYIYNGSEWVCLQTIAMQVHGNEYHDPDFEQQGVAASLIETHRTTATHTQDQPAAEHGNEKHNPDFATESALSSHEVTTTGIHGVGAGTITSKILSNSIASDDIRSTTSTSYVDIPDTTVTLTTVVTCDLLIPFAASLSHGTAGERVYLYGTADTDVYIFFKAQAVSTGGQEATSGFVGRKASVAAGALSYKLRWRVATGTGYTCYTKHVLVAIPL